MINQSFVYQIDRYKKMLVSIKKRRRFKLLLFTSINLINYRLINYSSLFLLFFFFNSLQFVIIPSSIKISNILNKIFIISPPLKQRNSEYQFILPNIFHKLPLGDILLIKFLIIQFVFVFLLRYLCPLLFFDIIYLQLSQLK